MTEEAEPQRIRIVIADHEQGQRLDRVLAARPELGQSRATLQRWFAEQRITLAGQPVLRRSKAIAGQELLLDPAPAPLSQALPEAIPIDIVFEDDDVLVVNKAAGMVVHPACGHPSGTLVNAVLYHLGYREPSECLRPGIVHRLDRDTSGVMVIAKHPQSRDALVEQFQAHTIERVYTAIAVGELPDRQTIATLHGRHPKDRKRFSSKVTEGKKAVTHVHVVKRFAGASVIECRLETGRTHQIRVHLADRGNPLLGDTVYGRSPRDSRLRSLAQQLGRQALHAGRLGFAYPSDCPVRIFESPLPEDMRRVLDTLASI